VKPFLAATRRDRTRAARRLPLVFLVLSVATVSCQSHSGSGPDGGGATPQSAAAAPAQPSRPIDVCAMVSPQDISALLGTAVPGQRTGSDPRQGHCTWENPTTNESVTVDIGSPDTALHNTLPPALPGFPNKPGPDGMRYEDFGAVDFPAGNRLNSVQVAVLRLSSEQRNAAAVDLARKIAPQVPG
jgi:hypothetical protein